MNSKNFLGTSYICYVTKNTFLMASPTTECYKFLEGRINPPKKVASNYYKVRVTELSLM